MAEKEKLTLQTTRFGELSPNANEVITFPDGLIGFGPVKEYVLLQNPGGGAFQWLQSVSLPELAFVVCDPRVFKPDYKVQVRKEDLVPIKIDDINDGSVIVIVVIPKGKSAQEMTANLKGPIIINLRDRLAKQLVIPGDEYDLKYPVFGTPNTAAEGA